MELIDNLSESDLQRMVSEVLWPDIPHQNDWEPLYDFNSFKGMLNNDKLHLINIKRHGKNPLLYAVSIPFSRHNEHYMNGIVVNDISLPHAVCKAILFAFVDDRDTE